MTQSKWERAITVAGDLQAEILRGLLEAQGIQVYLAQEGAGRAIGLGVGPLGEVEIMVPAEQLEEARQVLSDYRAGRFEQDDSDELPGGEED